MFDKGIEAFISVANTKSISAAAKNLYITQPAVTHRLKELEAQLGLILLDRQRGVRTAELTQAGEMFYPVAEKWRTLWQETKSIHSKISKISLRIGCVDSVSSFLLPDFYRRLSGSSSPIHLRIHTMRSSQLYEKIVNRDIDVAFVLQKKHMKHIDVKTFLKEPMCVVQAAGNHPPSQAADLEQLNPQKELYINWSPYYESWHDRQWKGTRHSKIELDSVTLALELIRHSDNWVILPRSAVAGIMKDRHFSIQTPIQKIPQRYTYMVTHQYPRMGGKQGIETIKELAGQVQETSYPFRFST